MWYSIIPLILIFSLGHFLSAQSISVDIPYMAFKYRSSSVQDGQEVYWEKTERAQAIYNQLYMDPHFKIKILSQEDFLQYKNEFMPLLYKVHDSQYLHFLENVYTLWKKDSSDNVSHGFIPENFAVMGNSRFGVFHFPKKLQMAAGYYAMDRITPIMADSYASALISSFSAFYGAKKLSGGDDMVRYVLARPPGHHAGRSNYGGFCFLNNAAIAAQYLVETFPEKGVVILDIDLHHGNGTQDIFYDRSDVLFVSLHVDPEIGGEAYPYFTGYADEKGFGKGMGFNYNFPLVPPVSGERYIKTLKKAIHELQNYSYDYLIISFGADTYERDPIGAFNLTQDDYFNIGKTLSQLQKKTLIIQEGGYAVDDLGFIVKKFLEGFIKRDPEDLNGIL